MKLTTTRLQMPTLPRPRFAGLPLPVALAICTFCLIAIAALAGRIASAPQAATVPTAQLPIVIIATPQAAAPAPVQQVVFQPAPAAAPARQVVAFAAPNGDVLGPIDAPALGAIVARFGDGWVATMHQGAMVWVRVSELGGNLANLAPAAPQVQPAAPAPVYVAPQQPIYQVTNDSPPPQAPEPTPAPAQPAIMAAPVQAPAAAPAAQPAAQAGPDPVTAAMISEQWREQHCYGSGKDLKCIP